ncbi:tetratricopeptide repeat protein [Chitinophagaceae bacterium LWZ2-11]
MTEQLEQLYLEAEADIRNNNYHEAFQKHLSIVYDEPDFAPSHNSLGWIYKTQFDDYEKAITHFKAAIRCNPLYPHPYFHLAGTYIDLDRFNDVLDHLAKCIKIATIDKGWVYYRYGMIDEIKGHYEDAIKNYERAILHTMNNDKLSDYKIDIERCRTKLEIINPPAKEA